MQTVLQVSPSKSMQSQVNIMKNIDVEEDLLIDAKHPDSLCPVLEVGSSAFWH